MRLSPLFSVESMLEAANSDAFILPENEAQVRTKARASGIANCARAIAYYMVNAPVTNPGRPDMVVTTEQGRIMEDLSIRLVEHSGDLRVVNRQIELPDDYPLTGHPDGEIMEVDFNPHRDEPKEELFHPNGLKWGFEHKHPGRYAYETIFKKGLEIGEPGYLAQAIAYADALNWDAVMWVIMSQDASSVHSDAQANLRAKRPEIRWAIRDNWNPKYQVFAMDMRPYKLGLAKRIRARGEWFMRYAAGELTGGTPDPDAVMREADPEDDTKNTFIGQADGTVTRVVGPNFPCSHCPWLARCLEVGQGKIAAPELPFKGYSDDED